MHPGFTSQTRSNINITVDQMATLDFSLSVGEVTQSVEVSGAAETINTTNGAIGQVISANANCRTAAERQESSDPGDAGSRREPMASKPAYSRARPSRRFPSEGGASVSGGRQGSTYYMLDGGNNMDNYGNLAMAFPNPDATQEFQVITNNFDAQYGFRPEPW